MSLEQTQMSDFLPKKTKQKLVITFEMEFYLFSSQSPVNPTAMSRISKNVRWTLNCQQSHTK